MSLPKKLQLTIDEYRSIQIILTQASEYGAFRALDSQPAIDLFNKIKKILEYLNNKSIKNQNIKKIN